LSAQRPAVRLILTDRIREDRHVLDRPFRWMDQPWGPQRPESSMSTSHGFFCDIAFVSPKPDTARHVVISGSRASRIIATGRAASARPFHASTLINHTSELFGVLARL
jgi:hypothetical protein